MGIKSLSNSSGIVNFQKHQSMLAGIELNKFHHLETVRLGSSAASVEFTNLGQYSDFQHLQIRMVARSDEAGSSNLRDLRIQANADTGSNYAAHVMRAGGDGNVYSNAAASQSSVATSFPVFPRPSNPTTQFGAVILDVLDAFETTKYTTFRMLGGAKPDGEDHIWLGSGLWMNTNALTEIKLFANSGNFGSNSRFSLYGLKARA